MKKKTISTAVLILGTGAALAAAAIPAPAITPAPEPVAGIVRLAEAYATADPIAEEGMQEAVRRCMAKAGFDYTQPRWELTLDLNGAIGSTRLTVEVAKPAATPATGRRLPASPHRSPQTASCSPIQPSTRRSPAPPAAAMSTVAGMGTSSGGCRGEAMTQIYGSAENYLLATGIAYNSFFIATSAAGRDPGVAKADNDWKACRNESSYSSYANPGQAADAGKRAGGQEEFKIAVIDAGCRDRTGFHPALDNILDRYLTTRMQQLAPEIDKVKEIRRNAAANAAPILAAATK
jgi:hypothetical protein